MSDNTLSLDVAAEDAETILSALTVLGRANSKEDGVYLPEDQAAELHRLRDDLRDQIADDDQPPEVTA